MCIFGVALEGKANGFHAGMKGELAAMRASKRSVRP